MSLPTKKVEIGFDLSTSGAPFFTLDDPTAGVLDNTEFTLGGTLFYDVTDYVVRVSTNRGRNRELDRYNAGQLEVLFDNTTRVFDPEYTASPFNGQIIPHREIRISSNGSAVFYGLIDDWNLNYNPSGDNTASAIASDGFTLLAQQNLSAHTAIPQLPGARIEAVLDREEVAWPLSSRNIDAGEVTLQADAVSEGTNALSYLQTVEQTESGSLFIAKDGYVTFQDSLTGPSSATTVDLTDDGTGIPFSSVSVVYGSELLYNRVVVTRQNGEPQTVNDTDSQNAYGISSLNLDNLLFDTDADSLSLAQYLVGQYSEPEYRFDSMTIQMSELTTAQQNQLLTLELTDQVRIKFTPNGIGDPIIKYAEVTGISHNIGILLHELTFNFSTLDYAAFVLDDPTFGVLAGKTTYDITSVTYDQSAINYDGNDLGFSNRLGA
jgi:hypothetical protein